MTDNTNTTATREAWLMAAIEVFRPRFVEIGFPLPERVRVSVGWGSTGARQESAKILGVTYHSSLSGDGVNEVFVTPEDADTASMLETLLHELIHVALDCEDGHKGRFAEAATRLGFVGPMTATPPSIELAAELVTIAAALGPYPGSQINLPARVPAVPTPVTPGGTPVKWTSGPGTQTTRMIKLVCPEDGYAVRTTKKWIERGLPFCPDGHRMQIG